MTKGLEIYVIKLPMEKKMIGPGSDIEAISKFFAELSDHSQRVGIQSARELILSRVKDRGLQTGLTLAAEGNHPTVVRQYLSEALLHEWQSDLCSKLLEAVHRWQTGCAQEEVLACFRP